MYNQPIIVPEHCRRVAARHRTGGVDYAQSLADDFAMIAPHLPDAVESILDIGCGLAGIDVYLKQKYPDAHLTLLDSDGSTSNVGLTDAGGAGGNRECAESLLAANGVKPDQWLDIGTEQPLAADLVISLLSWGFHYPLSAYRVTGLCIADIRRGQAIPGTVIFKGQKADRTVWIN